MRLLRTLALALLAAAAHVSPDSDATLDGEAGEGDRVAGAEVVEGGAASDTLRALATARSGYELIGGKGDDVLTGGRGADRLVGGAGIDSLNCGRGTDTAAADRRDRLEGCESRLRRLVRTP